MKKYLFALIVLLPLFFSCTQEKKVVQSFLIDQSKYELVGYVFEFNDGGGGFTDDINKVSAVSHYGGGFKLVEQVGVLRNSTIDKNISVAINYLNK